MADICEVCGGYVNRFQPGGCTCVPAWFLGESQLDPGEWGFDGTVWQAPGPAELAEQDIGGPQAEPWLVCKGVRDERQARLIAAAPEAIAAIWEVVQQYDYRHDIGYLIPTLRKLLGKAEGNSGK